MTPHAYAEACERAADFADSESMSDAHTDPQYRIRSDLLRALATALRAMDSTTHFAWGAPNVYILTLPEVVP